MSAVAPENRVAKEPCVGAFGNQAPPLDSLRAHLRQLTEAAPEAVDDLFGHASILSGITSALHETVLMGVDRDGRYLFFWMPPALEERYGVRAADMDGMGLRDMFPPDVAEERVAAIRHSFETGESTREEYPMELMNGTFWHDITLAPMRDSQGRVAAMVGLIRDVTERKKAEQLLAENEARYRAVVEQTDAAIIIHRGGIIRFHNRAARETLGIDAPEGLNGQAVLQFFHPDDRAQAAERLRNIAAGETEFPVFEARFVSPAGQEFVGEVRSHEIAYEGQVAQMAIIRDVTEQRQLLERARQSQKLESLGLLASGVAHDFNTLLLGVLGNAGLALADLPEGTPARERLEQIETAAIRASELTSQLLAFAGGEQPALKRTDLSQIVAETASLVSASLPPATPLELNLDRHLPPVMADAPQLRQVIMNLMINAAESRDGGVQAVRVRTGLAEEIEAVEQGRLLQWRSEQGPFVCLAISDDGCGMDGATMDRIFDPFYSTKARGRGLGLAATQGIVRSHRGVIRVESSPGHGASFEIYLPVCGEEED